MTDSDRYETMKCTKCSHTNFEYDFEKHSFINGGWAGCEYVCPKCNCDEVEIQEGESD